MATSELEDLKGEVAYLKQRLLEVEKSVVITQDDARHYDKLKTFETLAGSVVHKLGTALNIVTGYAHLIQESPDQIDDVKEMATAMHQQAENITRTIDTAYTLTTVAIGPESAQVMVSLPKLVAFAGALVVSALLILILQRTDLGRAIRAVAKEKQGARLMGIDVEHVYAMCFGLGLACLGAAACFLLPAYYVNPQVGNGFVLVAFTVVVLGGMGSFAGALLGGLLIGVVESFGGLFLGESLGQVGIFVIFIGVLLLRPEGLFGAKT